MIRYYLDFDLITQVLEFKLTFSAISRACLQSESVGSMDAAVEHTWKCSPRLSYCKHALDIADF